MEELNRKLDEVLYRLEKLVYKEAGAGKAEQRKVKTMESKTKTCPLKVGSGVVIDRYCELENCAWYYGADCAVKTIAGCLESRCEQ